MMKRGGKMKAKRLLQALFAAAGLAMLAATAFSASAPAGPSITVYRSPT